MERANQIKVTFSIKLETKKKMDSFIEKIEIDNNIRITKQSFLQLALEEYMSNHETKPIIIKTKIP
jgi:hypothetical protein